MDIEEDPQEAAFRAEVRAWFDRPEVKEAVEDVAAGLQSDGPDWLTRGKRWQAFLADHNWACITWPREYGGRGGTPTEAGIFTEEAARAGVAGNPFVVGVGMAGPTIIAHGTPEQKARYLPPMLRGEEVWCQLFSEPGAGSDLAGVATRADADGDEFVVNGQKVWTSGAHHSDFGMLLARTDLDAPKHRGITYFLLDMHAPGIDIRPLRQMTGQSHFSEVFLTDVRVPAAAVLGGVNAGWGIAMTTLANERTFMGGNRANVFAQLVALARRHGVVDDPVIRQGLAASFARAEVVRYTGLRIRTAVTHRRPPGPESMILKLFAGWNMKRNTELALAIQGAAGMVADAAFQPMFLQAPSLRIAGGSDEIQRNLLGERALGLPPEPRLDKDIPFRDLPR